MKYLKKFKIFEIFDKDSMESDITDELYQKGPKGVLEYLKEKFRMFGPRDVNNQNEKDLTYIAYERLIEYLDVKEVDKDKRMYSYISTVKIVDNLVKVDYGSYEFELELYIWIDFDKKIAELEFIIKLEFSVYDPYSQTYENTNITEEWYDEAYKSITNMVVDFASKFYEYYESISLDMTEDPLGRYDNDW